MKHAFAVLVAVLLFHQIQAQKEANIWYFGNGAGLDFSNGDPVILEDGNLNTIEGCASISNADGQLLFYTDGIKVYNRNHEIMPNGQALKGHSSSTQSGIVVPAPSNPDIYYLFTAYYQAQGGMYYSIINMTLNGGLGDIVEKNILLKDPATEKLTAVAHENGTDIWLIGHDWGNDAYLAYLVTSAGVSANPVVSNVGFNLNYSADGVDAFKAKGYIKASPDSKNIVAAHSFVGVELLDFDNGTGKLSNPTVLMESPLRDFYGVEFSPSSSVLYITAVNEDLYQFNLNDANPIASMHVIDFPTSTPGGMQLGPNGKIYLSNFGDLSVINNPEVIGDGANFEYNAIDLGKGNGTLGLPPFIASYFKVGISAANFCMGDTTEFSLTTNDQAISSLIWDFGDGTTSIDESPTHSYAAPGNYQVEVLVNSGTKTNSETIDIIIYATPIANKPTDIKICSSNAMLATDLTIKNPEILGEQSAEEFTVVYYPTLNDAQNDTNSLPNPYTNSLESETIYARVYNKNSANCDAVTSFEIIVTQDPELSVVSNWHICDTDTDGFYTFDLAEKNEEVLNGQNSAVYTVSYFETQEHAEENTNPLELKYTNISENQQIYFNIRNQNNADCVQVGSFQLEVVPSIDLSFLNDAEVCDDNNDGVFTFDLNELQSEILEQQSFSSITLSYYSSLENAENATAALNANSYQNTTPYQQRIFVRAENESNQACYVTSSFELIVYDAPVLNESQVENWMVCKSNSDGRFVFDFSQKNTEILGEQSITDFTISYYSNETDANLKENPILAEYENTEMSEVIYYRIEQVSSENCFVVGDFSIGVFEAAIAADATAIVVCDADETAQYTFDLSERDTEVLAGQHSDDFQVSYYASESDAISANNPLNKQTYLNSDMQEVLFARVAHIEFNDCYAISKLPLIIISMPESELEAVYTVCPDSPNLLIDGGDFISWSWGSEEAAVFSNERWIELQELGIYTLTVAHEVSGVVCEKTFSFEVVASIVPETLNLSTDVGSDSVLIIAEATGATDVEYSIDGFTFQDRGKFEVLPGEYEVYVRDKAQCRTISETIFAVGYEKFFTPNGDGINEYWNIIGCENFPNSKLYIYDRRGRLISEVFPNTPGWDGSFNGGAMLSSDYWFKYVYDGDKEVKGHFTLKR